MLQIQNTTDGTWYEAYICAHTGQLLSVNDFVAHASVRTVTLHRLCYSLQLTNGFQYTVLPVQKLSVADGVETLTDPQDATSSPVGWHNNTTVTLYATRSFMPHFFTHKYTSGNNVVAFKNITSNSQQTSNQTTSVLNFQYTYNSAADPTDPNNVDAARVNGFYIANTVHDVAYKYGFTENAFNFQFSNLDRGDGDAKDGDGVLLSIQDPSGTNNANFATPPE